MRICFRTLNAAQSAFIATDRESIAAIIYVYGHGAADATSGQCWPRADLKNSSSTWRVSVYICAFRVRPSRSGLFALNAAGVNREGDIVRIVGTYERQDGDRCATLKAENGKRFYAYETRWHPVYWVVRIFGLRRYKAHGMKRLEQARVKYGEVVYAKR
jgi:hypothetical protein